MKYLSLKNLKKAIKEPLKALSVLFHFNPCYSQTWGRFDIKPITKR